MEAILLIFIAMGEDLVHFLQGSKLWLGSYFGKSHNSLYKMNHDAYETFKISLTHPLLFSSIRVTLGSFEKPFPTITQGELEPQFASKDSYFEQNIKQVLRSNWELKKTYISIIFKLYYHSFTFIENLEAFGSIWRSRHQN